MPTVNIIIKGVALCYRKDGMWKVLFPFDTCHKVKFSYRKDDNPAVKLSNLAKANNVIEVTASGAADPDQSASSNYRQHILDLTSPGMHSRISRKTDWNQKAVLMTIENAKLHIYDYIQDHTGRPVPLVDTERPSEPQTLDMVGHSVRAEISLNNAGIVRVRSEGRDILTTDPGASYTLTFDNDCKEPRPGKNDMEMLYKAIEEPGKPWRMLLVGGRGSSQKDGIIPFTDPPMPEEGKPCLAVGTGDPTDLP